MQINTAGFETNPLFVSKAGQSEQSGIVEKKSFLELTIDKCGWKKTEQNGISYSKNGENPEDTTGNASFESRQQSMTEFIQQNLEQLKELVTDEDYSKMAELGLAPEKEKPHTLVTVSERIQIELATYCEDYKGEIRGISQEKLKQVLGSDAMAQALKKAKEIGTLDSDTRAYMIKNGLEPTIDQVYRATFSTAGGAGAPVQELSKEDWDALMPQVQTMLQKNGMSTENASLDRAKWLVEHQIAVTPENMLKAEELEEISGQEEILQKNIAYAMIFGMSAGDAYLTASWIEPEEAVDCYETIQNVQDFTLYAIARENQVLNIANLKKYQEMAPVDTEEAYEDNPQYIRNKVAIEEARMCMSAASFVQMQKLGISITYTEITVLVGETNRQEEQYMSQFLEDATKKEPVSAVREIMEAMQNMGRIPSAVLGAVYRRESEFTIAAVQQKTIEVSMQYEQAAMTYEAVGTQVRTDLGDSIQKAFDSVDAVLEEQGIEADAFSRRAARILAYNRMEINQEQVLRMESMMGEFDYAKEMLTPKTVAYLVEHQVDVLHTEIPKLNEYLEEMNTMIGAEEESYARYLWELEHKGEISEENREKYIDLYRTLHRVSECDARAIGMVAGSGADFTLGNLLTAVKSRRHQGMDVEVHTEFGALEELQNSEGSDTKLQEIGSFVKKMAQKTRNGLTAELAQNALEAPMEEISLTGLAGQMQTEEAQKLMQERNLFYLKNKMQAMLGDTDCISEDAVLALMEGGHAATMEHIASAMQLSTPGSAFRRFLMEEEEYRETLEACTGDPEDVEKLEEAAEELKNTLSLQTEYRQDLTEALRNFRFMTEGVKNQSYHIPVQIGEESVLVRVSFENREEGSKAEISMATESYGSIHGRILSYQEGENRQIGVVVSCEEEALQERFEAESEVFVQQLSRVEDTAVQFFRVTSTFGEMEYESAGNTTDSSYLFRLSKTLIQNVKEMLEKTDNTRG